MPTKPVLTKIPNLIGWIYDFDFQPKCNAVQHRSFGVNPTLDTDINSMLIFKPKFNVCPMLEADVNQTLGFRIDQIFISYHKPVSVQCWMLGSTKLTLNWRWVPAGPSSLYYLHWLPIPARIHFKLLITYKTIPTYLSSSTGIIPPTLSGVQTSIDTSNLWSSLPKISPSCLPPPRNP